jgi:acetyl esterase/lipase
MSWLEFRPGERDQIVAAVEGAKQLYVQVRNGTHDTPVEFVVAVADLPKTELCSADVPPYASAQRRADLSGLPHTWLNVSDAELLHDEGIANAARLEEAGVPARPTAHRPRMNRMPSSSSRGPLRRPGAS